MKFRSIKYFFSEAFSGVIRNRLMSVASIGTVAACIFMIIISYCALTNVNYMLTQIEESIGISIFLEDDADADTVLALNDQLVTMEYVDSVRYISSEEALDEMKQSWDAEDILSGFDETNNPLTGSFEVNLTDISHQSEVVEKIEQLDGVRKIRSSETETEFLVKLSHFLRIFGGVLILALAAISVVIITNTIKLSVFTRRTEISIMKYVGATDWFIRWPFIIEGIIIGIVGASIPIIIAWPLYNKLISIIYEQIPMIHSIVSFRFGIDIFSILLPVALIFGALLGVLGSNISLRKHLNV
ncbi:MAG TPA: permease-like cell division protein FtsX [Firmicutes bacterium]|nr:permease-like cell division protein FtsX [Bacillota bacterium]